MAIRIKASGIPKPGEEPHITKEHLQLQDIFEKRLFEKNVIHSDEYLVRKGLENPISDEEMLNYRFSKMALHELLAS